MLERARRRLAAEPGFTLIEIMVAAVIAAVSLFALLGAIDGSRTLISKADALETATHQAEREMERIHALSFGSIALTAAPSSSTDSKDPRYYVTAGAPPRYQWDQGTTGPQTADLVIDAGGALSTFSSWSDGQSRMSGEIHRFVTWTGDLCSSCTGVQRAKRITLAVTVDAPSQMRTPVLISSIKIDPAATG